MAYPSFGSLRLGCVALAAASFFAVGCKKTPSTEQAPDAGEWLSNVRAPKGLAPNQAPTEGFAAELLVAKSLGQHARIDGVDRISAQDIVRVSFALTWAGVAAVNRRVEPSIVDESGKAFPLAPFSPPPGAARFLPGVPQTFHALFEVPLKHGQLVFRPIGDTTTGIPITAKADAESRALIVTSEKLPSTAPRPLADLPEGFREARGTTWSMVVPKDWIPVPSSRAVEFEVRTREAPEGVPGDLRLTIEPTTEGSKAFADATLEKLKTFAKGITIEKRETVSLSGVPAELVESKSSPTKSMTIKNRHWFVVVNGRGFILTCAAPQPAAEAVKPICETAARTLRINAF